MSNQNYKEINERERENYRNTGRLLRELGDEFQLHYEWRYIEQKTVQVFTKILFTSISTCIAVMYAKTLLKYALPE